MRQFRFPKNLGYERQYTLATKNAGREKCQEGSIKVLDYEGRLMCINKSQIHRSLEENVNALSKTEVAETQQKHIHALLAVAKYIIGQWSKLKMLAESTFKKRD